MLITTGLIPKNRSVVTVWPFIFVRPEKANDSDLIEHEKVHYEEQFRSFVLPWLIRYWLSKKFRLAAELRAYKQRIELETTTIGKAAYRLSKSGFGIDYLAAVKELRKK